MKPHDNYIFEVYDFQNRNNSFLAVLLPFLNIMVLSNRVLLFCSLEKDRDKGSVSRYINQS